MKFLIMGRPGTVPMPPEAASGILGASRDYVKNELGTGHLDCAYSFVEGGGFAISEAGSAEEVMERLTRYPAYAYVQWEVKPLVEFDRAVAMQLERLGSTG